MCHVDTKVLRLLGIWYMYLQVYSVEVDYLCQVSNEGWHSI